jgi:hypothetical protein
MNWLQQVNFEYKLWGRLTDTDIEDDEGLYEENTEHSTSSSSVAERSNSSGGSGTLEQASSSNGASNDAKTSSRETDLLNSNGDKDMPISNGDGKYQNGNGRGNGRFWRFSKRDMEEQDMSKSTRFSSSNGWTVLEDSSHAIVSVDVRAPIDDSGDPEQESSGKQLQLESTSVDSAAPDSEGVKGEQDSASSRDNGAAAVEPLTQAELRQSPTSSSGQQGETLWEAFL